MQENQTLSIIIPSFNEQDNIERTFQAINMLLKQETIPFEVIFIDDGSKDLTYIHILELSQKNPEVKAFPFPEILAKKRPFLPDSKLPAVPAAW